MSTLNVISKVVGLAAISLLATTASALPVNLVSNGNFEAGNNGFTSGYNYALPNPGFNTTEGQYTVASNPYPWNGLFKSSGDHTSGQGLMMVANGAPRAGQIVWQSDFIAVASSTNYFFEAFVNNVCCSSTFPGNTPSILEFSLSLNGGAAISLGIKVTNLGLAGTWEGLSTQFISPDSGSVVLSLINQNTAAAGNDFAIDDVFFGTESIVDPTPTNVPEPMTLSLLALGLSGLGLLRRKRA
jgi:hypothetical protein